MEIPFSIQQRFGSKNVKTIEVSVHSCYVMLLSSCYVFVLLWVLGLMPLLGKIRERHMPCLSVVAFGRFGALGFLLAWFGSIVSRVASARYIS